MRNAESPGPQHRALEMPVRESNVQWNRAERSGTRARRERPIHFEGCRELAADRPDEWHRKTDLGCSSRLVPSDPKSIRKRG